MISKQTIAHINESARIEEVVGDFLTLRKRGSNYQALCPFHNEKTPSFNVSPAKGIYKCFGCGAAGNSTKFLMEHEHISYVEALRWLAKKYNIEIEEDEVQDADFKQEQQRVESIHIANSFAQKYFTDYLLNSEEGQSHGLSYFKERGFIEETLKKFQLGFSPENRTKFVDDALKQGYQKEVLLQAALARESGTELMSFFRGRAMFPIHNLSGKVVAFGARILKKDEKAPKYINTAESEVYQKSKILYGAYFAKNSIVKKDQCLLVEGYTDVISLHQSGIENVVASSGTSLTVDQIKLIKRFTDNITILYDGDAAGQKAAMRGIELILHEGMNIKVVLLPDNHDPDSFIKAKGAKGFEDFITESATDFFRFKLKQLMKDTNNDPAQRAEVIHQMVDSIALIDDPIKRHAYIKDCSVTLNIREDLLATETNKQRRKNYQKETETSPAQAALVAADYATPETAYQPEMVSEFTEEFQERDIIRLLFEFGSLFIEEEQTVADFIINDLESTQMDNPLYRKVIDEFKTNLDAGTIPDQNHFLNHPDPAISKLAIELLHSQYEISPNWEKIHEIAVTEKSFIFRKDIYSSLNSFKLRKVMRYINLNEDKLKSASTYEEQVLYLNIYKELLEKKKILGELAGGRVVVK